MGNVGDLSDINSMKNKNNNESRLSQCCMSKQMEHQICGRSKAEIEDSFRSCYKKKCKGDKNCTMQASFSGMMDGGMGGDKCKEYNDAQAKNCVCVDKEKVEGSGDGEGAEEYFKK